MRRDPALFGHSRSRWTLTSIRETCSWLHLGTLGGLSRLLDRLGISYKRGRCYIHSPDPWYDQKLDLIQRCLLRAWYAPEQYVFLYADELTYFRQPTVAPDYELRGHHQPLARLCYQSNSHYRLIGALNALTGRVTYRQCSKVKLRQMSDFYAAIRADYPDATEIYLVVDNWPVHFHPDVLARLQPQDFYPWPPKLPSNWPSEPSRQAIRDNLPIQLLLLPTYASWLNPVEKLWRRLKQEVIHLHRLSEDWPSLRQRVADFLDQFSTGSTSLLRYVGLLPD